MWALWNLVGAFAIAIKKLSEGQMFLFLSPDPRRERKDDNTPTAYINSENDYTLPRDASPRLASLSEFVR
jgi:hypothetical protein